ncbi:MAG: sulfotransferase domain-containing protein [Pseudomonadota bacterium]
MTGGIFWLASYPKSGNTWFRAFLHNLQADSAEPVDINEMYTAVIASGRGWMDEIVGFNISDLTEDEVERLRPVAYRWLRHDKEISYLKIHDAYTLLPDGEPLVSREGNLGALYIVRNPLDVAISFAGHMNCSIDRAIEMMGDREFRFGSNGKKLPEQLAQRLLSWSRHVASWVEADGISKEVIRYEDMKTRPLETFTRAAAFLKLPTERKRVEKAIRFSDIGELQRQENEKGFAERPMRMERFFRKGISGDWRTTLTPAQSEKIIADHFTMMRHFNYIDEHGQPTEV